MPAPQVLLNRQAKLYYTGPWKPGAKLRCASPDRDRGKAYELSYTLGVDGAGSYVQVTVPRLEYWTMLWWER